MSGSSQPDTIGEVLDRLDEAGDGDTVSLGEIVGEIGHGAFGPLLLVPALILVTPVSGVPGLPTIGSLLVSLIAIQIVLGRDTLWLPEFLTRREISTGRIERAIGFLRKPAGFVDRISAKRLVFLTQRPWIMLPAIPCALMVVLAPAFETVPFSVSFAGGAVALFALGMVARDGIAILLALLVMAAAGWMFWAALA